MGERWSLAGEFRTAEWPTAEVLESLCVHGGTPYGLVLNSSLCGPGPPEAFSAGPEG
jgi:hypothetical protein